MPVAAANDDPDPLVTLSQSLDAANAALALAHQKHEAVRKRLGTRAPPPSKLPRNVPKPVVADGAGAYRGQDARIELQRAVDEAKLAGRTLRGETSALESECPMEFAPPPFGETTLGRVVITLGILAMIGSLCALLVIYGGNLGGHSGGVFTTVSLLIYGFIKLFGIKKKSP